MVAQTRRFRADLRRRIKLCLKHMNRCDCYPEACRRRTQPMFPSCPIRNLRFDQLREQRQ